LVFWWLVALVSFLALVLLTCLVWQGAIFGKAPVHFALLTVVGLTLACGVAVTRARHHKGPREAVAFVAQSLGSLAAVAGVVYGLAGLIVAPEESTASTANCHGVPTKGGVFTIVTPDGGVTTRRGPSITEDQVTRLGSRCAVRVDGYCFGTPVKDTAVESRLDNRWLHLYRVGGRFLRSVAEMVSGQAESEQYIAAGTVQTQISESVLKHRDDCPSSEAPAPGHPSLTVVQIAGSENVHYFKVTADNTFDFGFAVYSTDELRTGTHYRQIPTVSFDDESVPQTVTDLINDVTAVAAWRPAATAAYLPDSAANVILGGVGCLGVGVPATLDPPASAFKFYRLSNTGTLTALPSEEVDPLVKTQLALAACREYRP